MKLALSGNFLDSSTYSDDDGRVIYKVQTTTSKHTIVSKLLSDDIPRPENGPEGDRFAHLARIDWKLNPSVEFGGRDLEAKTFLRRVGWAKDRVFTDEDGKEYRWSLGTRSSELHITDEAKTPVAKFRQRNIGGIFGEKQRASLEVFPGGESITDLIFVTFLFTEKTRRDM
ncbi:hypothetical protein PM082_018774 [Marasmius tenuissimus]|nr:hypothetical protein PM082_018774 [Marasmius tenuissimus]